MTAETAKLKLDRAGRLLGILMKARGITAGGAYGPDQLKALGKAFDDAWARIAPTVSSRAKAIEASRLKLAEVILSLAKQGNFDPQWLADTAVQLVLARSSRSQP